MISAPELHAMLEGWPEGVRNEIELYGPNGDGMYWLRQSWRPDEALPQWCLDLACMAAERHIVKLPGTHSIMKGRMCGGGYFFAIKHTSGASSHFDGPTLLHAVDGAVRGGKG